MRTRLALVVVVLTGALVGPRRGRSAYAAVLRVARRAGDQALVQQGAGLAHAQASRLVARLRHR
jgi:hypothetical protein